MFKIESYVTPILLSYVDKYVRDFKPADAQVSLWGGGVALHNLVLKADVLQQEVALPFTLVSGRIHELLIQVPWTKIMSEPIVVTIDTIECILSLDPPTVSDENVQPDVPSKAQMVEAPPGYMQALVRRIVSNISLRVHHLIVKYVQDDVVLSLNVKHLAVESAGVDWEPAFADIDQNEPLIRRLVRLDDLTLCLDRADPDGKIRYYQEPLLYRCQLDLRVWTRLVSASTRRASNLSVQLRSSRLAWGVTNEQLTLLIRLLRERAPLHASPPPPAPKQSSTAVVAPTPASASNNAEPVRSGSWSEWAWSWLPAWMDREGAEEAALPAAPVPVYLSAYLDQVSLVFKMMEMDGSSRKRARGVLELRAAHAAARAAACAPTALRVRAGVRALRLLSHGKCVCGYQDINSANEEATVYLDKKDAENESEPWIWPPEVFEDKIEIAEVAEEQNPPPCDSFLQSEQASESTNPLANASAQLPSMSTQQSGVTGEGSTEKSGTNTGEDAMPKDEDLWRIMKPIIYTEYTHVRSPPSTLINPYDNPPNDFEFSDWEEDSNLKIIILPLDVRFSIGLIHRLSVLRTIFQDLPPDTEPDIPRKTLTVEECDALYENLPQRRVTLECRGLRARMVPWDHSLSEKQAKTPLFLDLDLANAKFIVSGPLYPHRVCSAASQLPKDEGPLWQGARLHVSGSLAAAAALCARAAAPPRPVARADLRLVVHLLLHPELFDHRDSVRRSYTVKIHEINTCGSAARLQAAWQVLESLARRRQSVPLRHTTLANDALSDEEAVAIDATLEDITIRGFTTQHMNTHNCMVQTARVMAFYSPSEDTLKQAWLFSAPDTATTTPFLRIAAQLGDEDYEESLDYLGVWTAPVAACLDPLLIAWLAYRPQLKPTSESFSAGAKFSSQFQFRRRTPTGSEVRAQSSSGRGGSRPGSGAELVHAARPRSLGSSSDRRRSAAPLPVKESESGLPAERVLRLHARLRRMLLSVELGAAVAYVSAASASALDCATLTDALERHAAAAHAVLALSVGFVTICSNSTMKYIWNDVRNDGPTYRPKQTESVKQGATESFPWKLCLSDVTCYTMEAREQIDSGRELAAGLRSQLKNTGAVNTRTVLEPVTTAVTLSVVTKTMQIRTWVKPQEHPKMEAPTTDEMRVKYFTTGADFKPATLKEFVRGPAKRRKQSPEPPPRDPKPREPTEMTTQGPVVSIGIHLHADTPPVTVKLEQDQVHTVAAAVHCLSHLHILMSRGPLGVSRQVVSSGSLRSSLVKSVSELEEQQSRSDEIISESQSDLVPILEYHAVPEVKLKKFLWFQWVMGGATLVVASNVVKLALAADDVISTVDLQEHYDQLKVKIASASVKYHKKNSHHEWAAGVLGGRVLEAREPANGTEDNHFLAVTITQAQISNLPDSWKEELHPKLLLQKTSGDSMWEIYATLAPLEAVIQPAVLENILTLAQEMAPPSFCPLDTEIQQISTTWQWPYCYISAGGLRLLIATDQNDRIDDDTFMLIIGKLAVNPYPENPICRRAVNPAMEGGWAAGGGLEGRQYELFVQSVAVQSAQFNEIAQQEATQMHNTGSENPAVKWTQPNMTPIYTPILYPVEISCVLAPALYLSKSLVCGPALELNLASDCTVEVSLEQLKLMHQVIADAKDALTRSIESCTSLDDEVYGVCPYALIIKDDLELSAYAEASTAVLNEEDPSSNTVGYDRSFGTDSGVDMSTAKSSRIMLDASSMTKKTVSIALADEKPEASDYLEVFVTMGTVNLELVVGDDDSPEVIALRPPWNAVKEPPENNTETSRNQENTANNMNEAKGSLTSRSLSRSLTETVRNADIGQTKLELNTLGRTYDGYVPLVHVTLHQPNLYYWKKKTQSNTQVSIFNAWIGLGNAEIQGFWNLPILSTAKGVPDPVTDIPPALATIKIVIPLNAAGTYLAASTANSKGTVNVDIERPVLLEVSGDRLRRINLITEMISSKMMPNLNKSDSNDEDHPALYRLRKFMLERSLGSLTIQMSQLGVSGTDGTAGWASATLQVAAGLRPDRLGARALVTALLAAAGPPGDCRHVVLQPLMLGMEFEARWDAWRRIEGGISAREPSVHMTVDLDRVTFDVRPSDLATLSNMQGILKKIYGSKRPEAFTSSIDSIYSAETLQKPKGESTSHGSGSSIGSIELEDHYYKDDLKSGAFKIVTSSHLPMAYQVTLYGATVSWRYPHPRTITRIMLYPIPGVDEEVSCVLELYSFLLRRWMPHTYLKLPVLEPREFKLYVAPPDAVFGMMWRVRAYADMDNDETPFEFKIEHYMPRADPLSMDRGPETPPTQGDVSAEQLSSALRVDSYFAPRLLPRVRLSLRCAALELHAHNSLPYLSSQATALEGYYVSRPLMRSHRVLRVAAGELAAHALLAAGAGRLLLVDTRLSCDVMECTTGTLQQAVGWTRARAALSAPSGLAPRARAFCDAVRVALHVPRLRTLAALCDDWSAALDQYNDDGRSSAGSEAPGRALRSKAAVARAAALALEGRVSLWLHNSCAAALRVGQEGTDEIVPLGPGARLAYRWRFPNAPLRLRFALAGPSADWHWSASVPFTPGVSRVRLEDAEALGGAPTPGGGVLLHACVAADGARRSLSLAGRLVLANVLRRPLLYKVRARCADAKAWRSVCSGELDAESVGRSVLCGADCEMVLKIKFTSNETGWSGDIPLKECPKENVPWLVKVPSEGDTTYVSVWCRVVRARADGRVLAAVWPLYVLRSHLPLDTDVLVTTETELSTVDLAQPDARPPPLVQTTPGRGGCTHLLAPGTTAARHQLSFQYKDIECPVTREAIPLHYGVTDTSVFDKRAPVNNIEDVVEEIRAWFDRSERGATSLWPYSTVATHWFGNWHPAKVQPRCDVTVRYGAVRAGGGCSLEIQLCPVALLCNAAPLALTLRAHDAAPLCKVESGAAIAAPSAILQKPFFMSVEVGRETFVSPQLRVWAEEPGRYGSPPRGCVALDHAAPFAIQCNHKVALLTLYYEIKEEINVLGITPTFMVINRLNTDLLVSAIAVPMEIPVEPILQPKSFKVVAPTKEGSLEGEPLPRFYVPGRWRGGDAAELRAFLCLALPTRAFPERAPAPVRLGLAPFRRALHLVAPDASSVAVVVIQQKHEGRWLVTVARDPCPQFVVHNRTSQPLAIAQPARVGDAAAPHHPQMVPECPGARWWCEVAAGAVAHYSTPAHNARFPPTPQAAGADPLPYIAIGSIAGTDEPDWGAGVAAAAGEQLLQLPRGDTVKLRVHPHPHSTLLELQDVDQNDISASDIRRRLQSFSQDFISIHQRDRVSSVKLKPNIADTLLTLSNNDKNPETCTRTSSTASKDVERKLRVEVLPSVYEKGNKLPVKTEQTSMPREKPELTDEVPKPPELIKKFENQLDNDKQAPQTPEAKVSKESLSGEPQQTKDDMDDDYLSSHKQSTLTIGGVDDSFTKPPCAFANLEDSEWDSNGLWCSTERVRCVISGIAIEMAEAPDVTPLFALHFDRAAVLLQSDHRGTRAVLSIADVQVDNLQYSSGQYDFGVVASTRAAPLAADARPPLWGALAGGALDARQAGARLLLRLRRDRWTVAGQTFTELTEVEASLGPLALYVEDSYVAALARLARAARPAAAAAAPLALADARALRRPLRLRSLLLHPLDLTLTLHTAVRMYIALDQSPLRLSAFQLQDMMISVEHLTHALTVHYLSAAILGAGWVVGGLELLGAPGALAARVGGATGGVRGVAAAAAAALLRSLSACAGSLARNLDLLAGDEEHAQRAAAARRRPPASLAAGLAAGITNFAINILGAVGGLAHHPLVAVAVGEAESSATALRRGLLGALAKPLSATADLVAYAGTGLLRQTGWDPVPQPRAVLGAPEPAGAGWQRDCVRWAFRLAELSALSGFEVLLDGAPLRLLLTHKFLVVADPDTERIVEMIDFRFCTLGPYQGSIVELMVTQRRQKERTSEARAGDEDDEYQVSAAAMARVARYTGAGGAAASEARVLALLPPPRRAPALHAALAAAVHHNAESHLHLL